MTVLQEHVHKGELDFSVKEFCFGVHNNVMKPESYKTVVVKTSQEGKVVKTSQGGNGCF